MAVDKEYLVCLFEEFSDVDSDRIDKILPIFASQISATVFGTQTDYATALLLAHVLKISKNKGSGMVTSKKAGDLSIGFSSSSDDELGLTAYGLEFKRLRRSCVVAACVV